MAQYVRLFSLVTIDNNSHDDLEVIDVLLLPTCGKSAVKVGTKLVILFSRILSTSPFPTGPLTFLKFQVVH